MKRTSLPLAVDIGSTRVRVLHALASDRGMRFRAAATRDLPADACDDGAVAEPEIVAALLEEALIEIGTRERRCIAAIGEPSAVLRGIRFPKMNAAERERAARYEARRYVSFSPDDSTVRVHPGNRTSGVWAVGIARSTVLATRLHALKAARLRPLAVDHESCALLRAFPRADAVLDIGHKRSVLHAASADVPLTLVAAHGGAVITAEIQRELLLEPQAAEKRKRILGTAGAGERAMRTLASEIGGLFREARSAVQIRTVAVVGNAARLPGLLAEIEQGTGAACELQVPAVLATGTYPADVLRTAAPDWSLAAGLLAWSAPW